MSEKLVLEMATYQQSLCDSLASENDRYQTFQQQFNLSEELAQLDKYLRKLRGLQKDMVSLGEQSRNLKKRAQQLQQWRQQEDERFATELDRVKQMEQSLKPIKPTTKD